MTNSNKQSATGESSSVRVLIDDTRARQNTNRDYAVALAKIGVAVFPSSGKTPLIPLYNKLDTEISPADREAAIAKYREDHDDKSPIHVGATKDPDVVKRMFRAFRDAVPSVACGPTGIVVFDADQKDDGPAKMTSLWDENGGLPEGALASPTKSGGLHFIFADPDRTFTNKAGALKKRFGTDCRGAGGQIVAPGSLLDDGRSYGTKDDLGRFMRAIVHKTLPTPLQYITDLIGAAPEQAEGESVTPSKEREVIIEAMRAPGKGTAGRLYVKLQSLADVVPALQELKAQVGASNFVRRFKERLMLSDSEVDLYGGRLKLEDSARRGSSARLVFTPAGS